MLDNTKVLDVQTIHWCLTTGCPVVTRGLDVGMTVTLSWTELGILLKTLTTLLLERGARVLRVSVPVLCVEFTGMLNSVCVVPGGSTSVLIVVGDIVLVKPDVF